MLYLYHVNTFNYIELKDEIEIGRTQGTIILGFDSKLSSKHVKIYRHEGNQFLIEDLASKNKTILDRVELKAHIPVKVQLNSVLEIGGQKFIFTNNNQLQILEVNEILDRNQLKPISQYGSKN